jgi:Zn-dependent protease with chaperone function
MQLIIILAIISAISISEAAPAEPVANGGWRLLQALVAMAIAPLFAMAASNAIVRSLRGTTETRSETMRWFGRLRVVHALIWLLIGAMILQQVGWVRMVRFNWQLGELILIDELLILLPLLASLLLSWAAFYRVARAVDSDAQPTLGGYLALQARHYLALVMTPVLLVLTAHDAVRLASPAISPEAAACLLLLPVIGLILFFPLVVRMLWRTRPMREGPLFRQLTDFARSAGFHSSRLFVWQTGGSIVNAAVAGFVRPWRYVFFSDALLERFDADEIEVVLAHEIGHVRRNHLAWRMLVILVPVVAWCVAGRAFPEIPAAATKLAAGLGIDSGVLATIAGPVFLLLYALTLFAAHSRLLEHDADLYAARLLTMHEPETAGCDRVARVLDKLARVGGIGHHTRSWLHPTIADRMAFLQTATEQPTAARRFEGRLVAGHRCLMILAVILLTLMAVLPE